MAVMLLVLLALAILALVLYVANQPNQFRVERSLIIAAPASEVFPHIDNLSAWHAWSPWARMDPNAQITFDGPQMGEGASFKWAGNNKVGVGGMFITKSVPYELIRIHLEFLKPFKGSNTAEFTFEPQGPEGRATRVTWAAFGPNTTISKIMSLFFSCEKIIGGNYEQGLANLKAIVEKK